MKKVMIVGLILLSLFGCGARNPEKVPLAAMRVYEMFPGDKQVQALALAASTGDIDRMDRLVANGANVNAIGTYGVTLPTWVIENPNKEGFKRLMELGADPDIRWSNGSTLLNWIARRSFIMGTTDYLQMALEIGGGDPNIESQTMATRPIEWCLGKNDIEAFLVLYRAGAEIDYIDGNGTSLLSKAAGGDNYELVYFMLSQGVDFMHEDKEGEKKVRKWLKDRGLEYGGVPGPEIRYNIRNSFKRGMGKKKSVYGMWFWLCVDFLEQRGLAFEFLPDEYRPKKLNYQLQNVYSLRLEQIQRDRSHQ